MQGLVGDPNTNTPGPDMGGLIQLGQTVDESLLLLAQALPQASEQLSQAREIIMGVLAQASQETAMGPPVRDTEENSGAGTQFPGGPVHRGGP